MIVLLLGVFFWGGSQTCQAILDLPNLQSVENFNLTAATQVFDCNNQLIAKLFEENRVVVPISKISPYVQQAVVANEDSRFYSHFGIDPLGIIRALWVNIRIGGIVEGGSTITQQLAKNLFLTQERTMIRKMKELLLAIIIERKFSKQEILQAYLNQIYFGEGSYGIESAAQVYYGKHANELSLSESAMLAGLPRGPSIFSPYIDMNAALSRRSEVLKGMEKEGFISSEQRIRANEEIINLKGKRRKAVQASYFLDFIAEELVQRYGVDRVYRGGLQVYTTLDSNIQQVAEGTLGKYQGSIFVIDPRNGYVKALVGGRNYEESQVNRVTSELRQPGSAFKPFIYAVALSQGLASNSMILDEPINIAGYSPKNYDNKYHGKVTLKKALRLSINIAAVKLGRQVGMDKVMKLSHEMGITTLLPQDNNLAAALGGLTQGVSLYELTMAYSAFANGGIRSKPIAILKVVDGNGQILEESKINQQRVLSPEVAYILTDMMEGVIESGTGTGAMIYRAAAGKTGTTDNYETAWFIGYTPELLAGIYVGNDDRTSSGISGGEVAGLWGSMMKKALAGIKTSQFSVPENIVTGVPICANSGNLVTTTCREVEYSAFVRGTEPQKQLKAKNDTENFGESEIKDWFDWKELLPRLPRL